MKAFLLGLGIVLVCFAFVMLIAYGLGLLLAIIRREKIIWNDWDEITIEGFMVILIILLVVALSVFAYVLGSTIISEISMTVPFMVMGEKSYKAFKRKLESIWNKQQKQNKMNKRPFQGHVVSGGPVTMKEAREAGLIKGEPKEATPEEHEEAIKTAEMIEDTVEKVRKDEKADSNS